MPLFSLSMQLVSLVTKYFQFLILHLPELLPFIILIKISRLSRYLELLILVSENQLTQLHVQTKCNGSEMEEAKKPHNRQLFPTASAGCWVVAKGIRLTQKSYRV